MFRKISYTIGLFFYFFLGGISYAQATFSSAANGPWDDINTWSITGTDSDTIPDSNDDVIINHDVSLPANSNASVKSILTGASGNLQLIDGYKLIMYGDIENNGQISGAGKITTVTDCEVSGSGSFTNDCEWTTNSNLFLEGISLITNRIMTARSGGDIYIRNNSSVEILGGITSSSAASFVRNFGTLKVSSSNFFTSGISPSSIFISNASTSSLVINENITIPIPYNGNYNDVTINQTKTATVLSNIDISGDLTVNGILTFPNAGSYLTFNGSSSQTFDGSGTCNVKNLTLNNSNGLLFADTVSINLDDVMESTLGTFTQNGANITLVSTSENTAGLVKLNTASDYNYLSGDFTVQRYYAAAEHGWKMVAAPIQSATLADWNDEFIYCGVLDDFGNPVDYSYSSCGSFYSVYSYNESNATPTIGDGFSEVTLLSFGVSDATGTLIYTSGQTPSNPSGATTLSVTGTPEFRSFTKPITKDNDGWNLISNPYPATLDWKNGSTGFYDVNSTSIDDAFYIYEANPSSGTARYKTITAGAQDIPHSQGFWVKKTSAGDNDLTFNINQTIGTQPSFIKSNNGINNPLVIKSIYDSTGYFDDAEIKSASNYSSGYDVGKEIFKLFAPYPEYASNIYFIDNSLNELHKICINNNTSDSLFFDVRIGSYASGNYTLEFENLKQFMIGSCIQMEDLHNGVITDLRQDSIYNFVSDINAPSPRFKLQINVDYDINVSNATCFQDSSATVSLNGSNLQGYYFNLIDTSGLLIDSVTAVSDSILFDGLNAGVFQYETNHVGTCPTHNQLIYVTEPEEVISLFSTISDTFYLDNSNQISINFRNLSTGSTYYEWDLGDGNTSNNVNPNHTYYSSGSKTVSLRAYNDSLKVCESIFQKEIYIKQDQIAMFESNEIGDFEIITLNDFIKVVSNESSPYILNLIDVNGKKVIRDLILKDPISIINTSYILPGMYLITINNDTQTLYRSKIILGY